MIIKHLHMTDTWYSIRRHMIKRMFSMEWLLNDGPKGYLDKSFHRKIGPARINKNFLEWHNKGNLHRIDGAAYIQMFEISEKNNYFWYRMRCSESEYWNK